MSQTFLIIYVTEVYICIAWLMTESLLDSSAIISVIFYWQKYINTLLDTKQAELH